MTVTVLIGDVYDRLRELPDESVHCVVTSPPYWGLRDYGEPGQIGLEPTLADHIQVLVLVFREVRRVMRQDATLWLNYGDGYAHGGNGSRDPEQWPKQSRNDHRIEHAKKHAGKPKDLLMMANRLAIALQDDGWWVRSEIIWAKPNPMPESVQDRPTNAHEKIWLLSKSARYYYDAEAVRTQRTSSEDANGFRGGSYVGGQPGPRTQRGNKRIDKQRGHSRRHAGFNDRWDQMTTAEQQAAGANLRNVWNIATKPFPEAHFATFPPALVEPCIKAGCPEGGTVLDPFGGSGTTGLVADRFGRDAILVELNREYAEMARRRIEGDAPLFTEVEAVP